MFFVLSKILSFLLTPIVWVLILLLLALFIRNRKKARRLLIIAVALLYFFLNPFIASEFMRMWEKPVTRTQDLAEHYDAGIVLGGGMVTIDKEYDRLTFRTNTDRILQAVDLYKTNRIDKILISSGSGSLVFKDMLESTLLKRYLLTIGIPKEDILIDSISNNTRQNAIYSAKILKSKFPGGKFLLITSAFHMRRAMACFEEESIIAIPYCTGKYVGDRRWDFQHLFVPNLESMMMWDKLIHEVAGYMIYAVMGYL